MSTRARLFWTAMAVAAYYVAMVVIIGGSDGDMRHGLSAIVTLLFAAAMVATWLPGSLSAPSRLDMKRVGERGGW